MDMKLRQLLVAMAFVLAGCEITGSQHSAPLRPETNWVAKSSEWIEEAKAVYAAATAYVTEEAELRIAGTWIIILDIDETVLNNVQYQIERDQSGTEYSDATWVEWTNRKTATPVPGAIQFIKTVNELGGHIAFVTNRRDTEQLVTELNLHDLGVDRGTDFRALLTRARPDASRGKEVRFSIVTSLLAIQNFPSAEVIAYIGDNVGDKPSLDSDAWEFFCIDQGGMYGDPCSKVSGSSR